jgi:hypothetical protein
VKTSRVSLVTSTKYKGMHGYWPDEAEMNSSFFILGGNSVPHSFGEVDMRSIAPTIALIWGIAFPNAEARGILLVMTMVPKSQEDSTRQGSIARQ